MWLINDKTDKEEKYSKRLVEHIIKKILEDKIDKNIFFKLMSKELGPIIGEHFFSDLFETISNIEKKHNRKNKKYWMKKIQEKDKTFNK